MSHASCVLVLLPCRVVVECMRKQQPEANPQDKERGLLIQARAQGTRMENTPHFIFINPKPSGNEDPSTSLCAAWNRAIAQYYPSDPNAPFTVYEGKLNELDADLLRCDCIVSPANSYGIMDGGCATHS